MWSNIEEWAAPVFSFKRLLYCIRNVEQWKNKYVSEAFFTRCVEVVLTLIIDLHGAVEDIFYTVCM